MWGEATFFEDWLGTGPMATTVATLAVLGAAAVMFLVLHRLVLPSVAHRAGHTAFRWDDILVDVRLRRWSAATMTLVAVGSAEPLVPGLTDFWSQFWIRVAGSVAIVAGTLAVSAFLMALNDVYETLPISKERPIKGYLQVVQIVAFTFGDIWVVAVLTGQTPWYLLSGLGAAAAVLLILYREPILSLSASMLLAQNDMVRVGDWIEMPEYGADGTVVDMALATVKIQNWDNTITTLPTHRLTSGSFKNWRGMAESGARRIKFPIHLDMSTVRFLDGSSEAAETESAGDGPTNVDALQRDLVDFLRRHPAIDSRTMPVMVRQLAPTPDGLPLELYVFCRETDWQKYEAVKGEIITHCLATLDRFGLRAFQHPTDAALRARAPAAADPRGGWLPGGCPTPPADRRLVT